MLVPDRAAGVRLVTDREHARPFVHEMTDDDPIARRAVAIVREQGMDPLSALEAAEREADALAESVSFDLMGQA